jgi:hypothetical protein
LNKKKQKYLFLIIISFIFLGSASFLEDGKVVEHELQYGNVILRGCSIKNTDFIIGVVAYTG